MAEVTVVSPHCDDAVFGAGDFIAAHQGALVVTVFAGDPADRRLRPWDADCGFVDGDDVMARRRAEDAEALASLGARPVWLPFRDEQYGRDAEAATIACNLEQALPSEAGAVAMPLGLFHRDHVLAADAVLLVAARRPELTWLAYADAVYRALSGDLVGSRVDGLRACGYALEPLEAWSRAGASALKRRAVACYASQVRGLAANGRAGHGDVFAAERWWRVRPA